MTNPDVDGCHQFIITPLARHKGSVKLVHREIPPIQKHN